VASLKFRATRCKFEIPQFLDDKLETLETMLNILNFIKIISNLKEVFFVIVIKFLQISSNLRFIYRLTINFALIASNNNENQRIRNILTGKNLEKNDTGQSSNHYRPNPSNLKHFCSLLLFYYSLQTIVRL